MGSDHKEVVVVLHKNSREEFIRDIKNNKETIKSEYNITKFLFDFSQTVFGVWIIITWIAGFVLAKGFWSTFFCIIPFYAWYLVVEAYLGKYGLL